MLARKQTAAAPSSSLMRAGMTAEQATALLTLPAVTLRTILQRNASAAHDSVTVARAQGITAHLETRGGLP
jgi:hypothetical protein